MGRLQLWGVIPLSFNQKRSLEDLRDRILPELRKLGKTEDFITQLGAELEKFIKLNDLLPGREFLKPILNDPKYFGDDIEEIIQIISPKRPMFDDEN